jgi:GNAT superfamily N-acetyltransferase
MPVGFRGWLMHDLTIREVDQDEEFAEWMADVLQDEANSTEKAFSTQDHYLVLADQIGDWIGGLRYTLRGGVAHLLELLIIEGERHQGYGHRLLGAFEEHARINGAHLVEFWTQDLRSEGLLAAFGWQRVLERPGYIGEDTWFLLERRLPHIIDELART